MKKLPGFRPMNPYIWGSSDLTHQLLMLVYHARFIPEPVRRVVSVWRINRTPGRKWSYRTGGPR